MKVLIVDDNKQARLMIKHFLRDTAYDFRECEDGAEALSAYTEFQPDWVLMDWEMPNVSGIAAVCEIIAEYPQANICMVTAFDDKDLRQAAFRAGASRFVLKNNLYELEAILVNELEN